MRLYCGKCGRRVEVNPRQVKDAWQAAARTLLPKVCDISSMCPFCIVERHANTTYVKAKAMIRNAITGKRARQDWKIWPIPSQAVVERALKELSPFMSERVPNGYASPWGVVPAIRVPPFIYGWIIELPVSATCAGDEAAILDYVLLRLRRGDRK